MRPTEESLAIKAKKEEVENNEARAVTIARIWILENSLVCNVRRDCKMETRYHREFDLVLVKLLSMAKT